ncbi:MAG: helix-turn-helix transcriptional regulator [Chloroflexi bacterium]|nr:helix-turn-helix transcriptional regulator [Chloroflexota bacterium]
METQALVLERKIIGVLIRAARESAHRTEKQVAQRLGVSPARLRQYEMGTRDISLPELEILALSLRRPLSFFLSGDSTIVEETPAPPSAEEIRVRRAMIAAKLKQARLAAGKTKEQAAQAVGRTVAMFGRYERGLTDIPVTDLERLAEFLRVNLNYFVQESAARRKGLDLSDLEGWAKLPPDIRAFILDPVSLPYLRMALKFRDLPAAKLKELGEILLVVR